MKPPYLQINFDATFLRIGPKGSQPLSLEHIEIAAGDGASLVWCFYGATRMIPAGLIAHTWAWIQDCQKLQDLGRVEALKASWGFSWDQTVELPGENPEDRPCVVRGQGDKPAEDSSPTQDHPYELAASPFRLLERED
jgi:hypothetical protein